MARYKVRALVLEGTKYYWCGGPVGHGHPWPRGENTVEIEVVDEEADPAKDESKHEVLHVGQATFRELCGDKNITIVPAANPLTLEEHVKEIAALQARIADLEAENADLKAGKTKGGDKGQGETKGKDQGKKGE